MKLLPDPWPLEQRPAAAGKRCTIGIFLTALTFALVACSFITSPHVTAQDFDNIPRGIAAYAPENVSRASGLTILFTGHLNYDAFPDTVLGVPNRRFSYLPSLIVWGRPRSVPVGGGARDSVLALWGVVPDSLRVAYTTITYPLWSDIRGSVAFSSFNPDSLTDMLVTFRGGVLFDSVARDTMRTLLVLGQDLDTHPVLNLATVPALQVRPFVAFEFRPGVHLVDEATRDLSYNPSYEITPVAFAVEPPGTNQQGRTKHEQRGGELWDRAGHGTVTVRAMPNPASTIASVEATPLPAGRYDVEIITAGGDVAVRTQVELAARGNLLGTLDVAQLASGYYLVRVASRGATIGTYPILITR